MRIPESKIAEVAAATDIVTVISEYVDLKKSGKDYRGLCPFHGDKDPSFYVSPSKGIFHCFGCAVGGSVFNFVMRIENISFVDAVRTLANRYGVPFEIQESGISQPGRKDRLFHALETASQYFQESLSSHQSAQRYLLDRAVSSEWASRLGLGYAPDSWDGILTRLRLAGVQLQDAAIVGLVRERSEGGYYDYFRSRLIIPITNLNGQLIAFGGRIIGEGEPKYLNSPESDIFRKKSILFGLAMAKDAIRREGYCILVEGYFDQIALRMQGIENTVAPLGTALGVEQVRLIRRFCDRIIALFDSDEAGLRALKRSIPMFLAEGMEPYCVVLQHDKDPDEAMRRLGVDAFRALLDEAVPIIDFFLDSLQSQHDLSTIRGRNQALEECLPVMRDVADSKERDYLIERISSRIRIREDRILRALTGTGKQPRGGRTKNDVNSLFDFPADERNIVRGMLLIDGFIRTVEGSGVLKDIENPVLSDLAARMIEFNVRTRQFDPRFFLNTIEEQALSSLVAKWLNPRPEEDDLRPEVDGVTTVHESLDRIRLRRLDRRKDEIKARMKTCAPGDDEYNRLAQELWSIGRRLYR